MISLLKILTEENKFFLPERSREERMKNSIKETNLKVQKYIKSGSKGDLSLPNNITTRLPDNLKQVNGDLMLGGCVELLELPENLKVTGSLVLSGCKKLKELPAGLEVGINLYVNGTEMVTLPQDLKVGQYVLGLKYSKLLSNYTLEELQELFPNITFK